MRRHEFLATLAGAAMAGPLPAGAQQSTQTKRVAALLGWTESDPEGQMRVTAFRQRLTELGWREGQNLQLDIRNSGSNADAASNQV